MGKDYIIYAKYQAIRNKQGKITDLKLKFASSRFINVLGYDPAGKMRSEVLDFNNKICKMVQNVLDFGIAKHYSYTSKILGYMEEMIEPDLSTRDCVNVYSIDINQLKQNNNEQTLRNNVSTLMSLFNITLLHWNAHEHYVYSDNILTTNFHEDNADLYVGNNVRSSYDLVRMADDTQRENIEKMVEELTSKQVDFLSFDLIVKSSIGENTLVKVNIIPEDKPNMYLVGIQF